MSLNKIENNPIHNEKKRYKYMLSPRCGAKTRKQTACLAPAIRGKQRCRMHGGKGSGAPKGNQNAIKHGCSSKTYKQKQKEIMLFIKQAEIFCSDVITG